MSDEIKKGARNSANDAARLQQIHDLAAENGATCAKPGVMFDPEKAFISWGTEVKALGDGRVGGYLVRFSDADTPDLTGDFFTKDCDFGEPDRLPVLYHHGLDETLKRKRIGTGACKKDDVGLWLEAQLTLRDEYEKAIYEMAQAGKLGWSSGAAAHTVDRAPEGKSAKITQWYIAEASLTPVPAEPRNTAISFKAYTASLLEQVERPAPNGAQEQIPVLPVIPPQPVQGGTTMTDEVKPQTEAPDMVAMVKAMLEKGLADIKAEMKTAEPVKTGGVAGILEARQATAVKTTPKEDQATQELKAFDQMLRGRISEREYKATLVEGTASLGGNLVPTGYSNELVTTLGELSIMRAAGAKVFPIDGTNPFVVPSMTRTTRAGASAMRVTETGAYTQMEPTFGTIQFDAWKRGALYIASDETLQDTRIPLTSIIQQSVSQQFGDVENLDFFVGTGSGVASIGQPNGLATAASAAASIGSVALASLTGENIISLYHQLPWQYRANGAWFMNDQVIQTLRKIRTGGGGAASLGDFLWQPGMAQGQPDRIMGRPVYTVNTMSVAASGRVAVFCDPRFYWIADFNGGAAEYKQLNELYAASGQVGWRFSRRFDGNLMVSEAAMALIAI